MHHPAMSQHIIPTKFSGWNIIYIGQKDLVKVQFFRYLSALIKAHPIPHAIFETTMSGFIQILYHCSMSWKITPLYFRSSNSVYFGLKDTIEKEISPFRVVGWKFTKSLKSYLKLQVIFSFNFASPFSVMRDQSSVLF